MHNPLSEFLSIQGDVAFGQTGVQTTNVLQVYQYRLDKGVSPLLSQSTCQMRQMFTLHLIIGLECGWGGVGVDEEQRGMWYGVGVDEE